MEIITGNYTKLAIIECSVCRENHTLELIYDHDDMTVWFEMMPQSFPFSLKLKHWFLFKFYPELFTLGYYRQFFSIALTNNQIIKIIEVLEKVGYKSRSSYLSQNYVNFIEYFDVNGVMISKDKDLDHIDLSIHAVEKTELNWRRTTGAWEAGLSKEDTEIFIGTLRSLVYE